MVSSWIAPESENSDRFWLAKIVSDLGAVTVAPELIEACVVLETKASDRMPFSAMLPDDDPDVGAIANIMSVVLAVTETSLSELSDAPVETPAMVLLAELMRLSVPPAAEPGLSEPGSRTSGPNTPPISIELFSASAATVSAELKPCEKTELSA